MTKPNLHGLRILVVEDAFLIAETIRDHLEGCGCEVVGPAARVRSALDLMEANTLDGAVLDVNLGDELCFPVAAALREAGVPVVFLTGYDDDSILPKDMRDLPRLSKPFDCGELTRTAAERFGRTAR